MGDRTAVEAVRAALCDPADVCRRLGITKTRRQARGVMICCPSHDDRSPSCSVRVGGDGTIQVKCQAECGLSGDIFDLVAAVEHLDRVHNFREVLARAAALAAIDISRPENLPPPRPVPPPGPPPLADEVFAAAVAPMFRIGRLDGPAAQSDVAAYLRGRQVLEAALADGWAALPKPDRQSAVVEAMAKAVGIDAVRRTGLLRRDDGSDDRLAHPEARVVIPWRNQLGRVVNVQRRRIDKGEPRYVGARGRGFPWPYGVERATTAPLAYPMAFVEGAIDVLALRELLRARGEHVIVLGMPGLGNWNQAWAELARGR